jgi:hypothetical protein
MPTSVMVFYYEKSTVRLSMRKTQMNPPAGECASIITWTSWGSINWNKVARGIKSLQTRIVKAVKAKHFHKAKALLHLISRSFYGKLLAILRVTTNQGSRTCGVDKVLWNTPARKWKAIEQLSTKGYKAKQIELPHFDATKIIRHNKIISYSNPYDKIWDGYFEQRARKPFAKHKIISKLANATLTDGLLVQS